MAILSNREDDLVYTRQQIELFFQIHPEQSERIEYLKTAYPVRFTELLVDGVRIGYRPQSNGLLMWEGSFPNRISESVFSWDCVAQWTTQLVEKKKYFIDTRIRPPRNPKGQQLAIAGQMELDQMTFLEELPQTVIDEALRLGANRERSRLVICAYFMKDKALRNNAGFLQTHYGTNGTGFYMGGQQYALWYDGEGLRIDSGDTARKNSATWVSWEQAARRIRELLDMGRYLPQEELDRAEEHERSTIADGLLFTVRDFTQEAVESGYAPTIREILDTEKGFPDAKDRLCEMLTNPQRLHTITGEWQQFQLARSDNAKLLRFGFHRVSELLQKLQDLEGEPVRFTAAPDFMPQPRQYISGDEIDRLLRGDQKYRLRVCDYFLTHPDSKDREKYLRSYHGEYSGSHNGQDSILYSGKGIQFSHGSITAPYAKVELKWLQATKWVTALIDQGRFLSDEDRAAMGEQEATVSEEVLPEPTSAHRDRSEEMLQQAAQIAALDAVAPYERFSVRIHGAGYAIWDDLKEHFFPEDSGEAMIFPTEEAAQDRIPILKQEVEDRQAEEWLYVERSKNTATSEPSPVVPEVIPTAEEPAEEAPAPLAPPKPRREQMEFTTLHPEIPAAQRKDFRITDLELGHGTPREKYAWNVAAIRTLKQIEGEERLATPSEQEILARYVGWGGLSNCFDEGNRHCSELKSLLSETEYAAARASSLTAFYTAPTIIQAIYDALERMGFQTGNILEPSCGVGNFLGMLPQSMASSKLYGVEVDSISGRIAQQLYQNSIIAVSGFEKVQMPDSFFDVAVGNVPFGDFQVRDKRYDKHHWLIHDYFLGKTLDKVRPGGILAFITSKGTMDKENTAVRTYLAQRADLIGAIRLPNTAFKANAGTEVTSDILFLQKRDKVTDIQPDWVHLNTDPNGIRMNRYFVQHPEMVLGEMVMESTRFGMDAVCKPQENADLAQLLNQAIQNLHGQITTPTLEEREEEDHSIAADPAVRNFSYTIVDGSLYFRENSRMHPVTVSVTAEGRIRGLIALRDQVRKVIVYQTENAPDEDIRQAQETLNSLYDSFAEKYGRINSRGNNMAFSEDSGYYLLCSLEVLDDEGNFQRKADMFYKRTIRPHEAVDRVDTASEALAVSISERAGVDLGYMSELSGKSPEELERELAGIIFRDVRCGERPEEVTPTQKDLDHYPLVTVDEYLSGNVRRKLRMAKALYEGLPAEKRTVLEQNIRALEAVQPVDLTAAEIGVRIGANWVPVEVYQKFLYELLGTGYYARSRIRILRSEASGQWSITDKNADRANIKAFSTYGTKRMNAYHILEQTLNQKDVRIFDYVEDEHGNKKPVLNKKETAIAQDRQELIKQKFSEWVWRDIDRREQLCHIYNETFNSTRPREYDGNHIRFSGMNPEIRLRPHQINAIAHILYGGNTLLAHEVGAGKTFEIVAAAMEMKRLGLCTKSLVVVPNHIVGQWASEWLQLYPSANLLVATKKDFETRNRKKFCARIATGDYDAIIIGHSQFEKIPISAQRQAAILQQQIDEILFSIEEAKAAKAERYTVKQLERTRKSLEVRLEKLSDRSRKDDIVTFEELGVDRLFVDESHQFKNLFLATKMRNVGGISQTEAQKSSDLFMKCRYLDELTGNRGTIFATGTPISNSMVELYTVQRYLQYHTLEEMGLTHFDDWASDFGETITAIELSPEGSGYRAKTRFAKFFNLPELMASFKQVADIQTTDMLKLPVPKANFHTEVISPSPLQQEMVRSLGERAERVRSGGVDPRVDNMLRITNDGRKLALDMRLVNPLAADDPNGKVSVCARNILRIWSETGTQRSTQLVFCDLSTPKGDGSFNVYDDLRQKLQDGGIPAEEIAYIHDANSDAKKKELFAKVRSGQVRVLMGSTQKMGAGTNCQNKLIALHDLECPWRPSDLAQRLGRIVRQGNQNPEVEVFRYVTEGTFDAYLYQLVENKQKFISQIMTSRTPVRVADDVDETALSYSEIKALATGNPLIIEKCNLDMEVGKLQMLKASYLSQKYALEDLVMRRYPATIAQLTERIRSMELDMAVVAAHPKPAEGFVGIHILGILHTEKETAGKSILDVCARMMGSDAVFLGQYRGFDLTLSYDSLKNEYRMTMKGTLSHSVALGTDVFGNLTRMDNALEGMASKLKLARDDLEDARLQMENARAEMGTPFAREGELSEKTARLKELNILLNMDEKDKSLIDDAPEEDTPERTQKGRENVR